MVVVRRGAGSRSEVRRAEKPRVDQRKWNDRLLACQPGMLVAVLAAMGAAVVPCAADPGAVVQRLQSEQASLLDWGLYRMNERLEDFFLASVGGDVLGSVTYSSEDNRILVSAVPLSFQGDQSAAKRCAQTIAREVRTRLFIDPDTGNPHMYGGPAGGPRRYFAHHGESWSGSFGEQLEQLCELEITVHYDGGKTLLAHAPLVSPSLNISE